MISCKYRTSSILPSMIIFTVVYCAKLMKQWANFDRGKVIFNESHWMTSNAAIIYLSYLINIFKGEKIGLIWDKHTSHYSEEVLQFIQNCNEDDSTTTSIVLELVDEGPTPIIQVLLETTTTDWKKVVASREMLVDFVLDTISEINNDNNKHQFIAESFRRCGLNPWSKEKSLEAFQNHLDALEKNDVL
jgi:hypothetical protein